MDVMVESPAMDNDSGAATTQIATTVYVPEHRAGAVYPLILHSHGWGGDRVTAADATFDSSNFYSVAIDADVRKFWDEGYAVISFDERGFQDSAGAVRVMDPEFETRDAIAILDWAEAHLDLQRDASGDPRVGTVGGSYGGGFQLLLAALDPRVDAITPSVTWHHLPDALAPYGVIKKMYAFGLCLTARAVAQRTFSQDLSDTCLQAADTPASKYDEDVDPALLHGFLGTHGMKHFQARHNDPADAFRMRAVDALFIQGQRDILFPLNEALANYNFLNGLGGDVRLISHQHGHRVGSPFTVQPALGATSCGTLDTLAATHAWFDAKLRGNRAAIASLPKVCISLDNEQAVQLAAVPVGGSQTVMVPATTVVAAQNNFGGQAPSFIALGAPLAADGMVLAGIPLASLSVTPLVPGVEVVALVGIGVQSTGQTPRLIDDQVTPLRSSRTHSNVQLAGVGERLRAGDQVGVLFYGVYDEFDNVSKSNYPANHYQVSGTVALPLIAAP